MIGEVDFEVAVRHGCSTGQFLTSDQRPKAVNPKHKARAVEARIEPLTWKKTSGVFDPSFHVLVALLWGIEMWFNFIRFVRFRSPAFRFPGVETIKRPVSTAQKH